MIRFVAAACLVGAAGLLVPAEAEAKGCLKGAVVGGVLGHVAGHGAVGAAAGCVVGRHNANKRDREQAKGSQPGHS